MDIILDVQIYSYSLELCVDLNCLSDGSHDGPSIVMGGPTEVIVKSFN